MYTKRITASCLLASVLVLLIDYITGRDIRFPILYVVPAGMAAWKNQKAQGYVIAVVLPLMRIAFHFPWKETQSLYLSTVNAIIAVSALILYVYLIDRTASQTRELEKEVRHGWIFA